MNVKYLLKSNYIEKTDVFKTFQKSSMNFKISCSNIKIRGLEAKLYVTFLLF